MLPSTTFLLTLLVLSEAATPEYNARGSSSTPTPGTREPIEFKGKARQYHRKWEQQGVEKSFYGDPARFQEQYWDTVRSYKQRNEELPPIENRYTHLDRFKMREELPTSTNGHTHSDEDRKREDSQTTIKPSNNRHTPSDEYRKREDSQTTIKPINHRHTPLEQFKMREDSQMTIKPMNNNHIYLDQSRMREDLPTTDTPSETTTQSVLSEETGQETYLLGRKVRKALPKIIKMTASPFTSSSSKNPTADRIEEDYEYALELAEEPDSRTKAGPMEKYLKKKFAQHHQQRIAAAIKKDHPPPVKTLAFQDNIILRGLVKTGILTPEIGIITEGPNKNSFPYEPRMNDEPTNSAQSVYTESSDRDSLYVNVDDDRISLLSAEEDTDRRSARIFETIPNLEENDTASEALSLALQPISLKQQRQPDEPAHQKGFSDMTSQSYYTGIEPSSSAATSPSVESEKPSFIYSRSSDLTEQTPLEPPYVGKIRKMDKSQLRSKVQEVLNHRQRKELEYRHQKELTPAMIQENKRKAKSMDTLEMQKFLREYRSNIHAATRE